MQYSTAYPSSPVKQTSPQSNIRLLREETSPYVVDDSEPAVVSTAVDPRLIVRACGATAQTVYAVVLANDDDGMPNTYASLAEFFSYSVRQMVRLVKRMEQEGFLNVSRSTGKSMPSVITAVRVGVTSGVTLGVTSMSRCDTDVSAVGVTSGVTSPPHTPRSVNTLPEEEDINPPNPPRPKKPTPYTDGFDQFWTAYPRRDDRKGALKVWERLKPDSTLLAEMLAAIERQGLADRERRYIPLPTTWLNGERWTDETTAGLLAATNGHQPVITNRDDFDPWGGYKEQTR
jgi:hypothetical protein